MKPITVQVGLEWRDIWRGGSGAGNTRTADVIENRCGKYGICGGPIEMYHLYRNVTVLVPDWVEPEAGGVWWPHPMTRPGHESTGGTGNLCFVTCRTRAESVYMYGDKYSDHEDNEALVQRAIDGGLVFWYPEHGKMLSMPAEVVPNPDGVSDRPFAKPAKR